MQNMATNSASDALMSVGSMMQKPAVNTKEQKLPSEQSNFQDAIKEKLNETQQPKDTAKDKVLKPENADTQVVEKTDDAVLEEAAAMVQNPMLQLFDQDVLTTMLRQDTMANQVVVQAVSVEEVQPEIAENAQQTTKLPEARMLQTTNETVEVADHTKENKQGMDIAQTIKNEVQVQKPVESTNEKQLPETTKQPVLQQPMKQELKDVEVVVETEEVQKPVQPMMLQTKQKTETGEVVHVKVADVLPVNKENVAQQLTDKILLHNNNEFELQLHPQSLGKIQIKVHFDNGETRVSILCENAKAMHLLSENTSSLASMLENRTGNQTTIQIQENKDTFYKQETDQNGHQQQQQTKDEQQQRQQKQKHQNSMDFLQQMRLGLV